MSIFDLFCKKLKYLVIGAGATGGVISSCLKYAKKDVTLVTNKEYVLNAINRNGINLQSKAIGNRKVKVNAVFETFVECKYDVIFVCLRSCDFASVLPLIERVSTSQTVIIPLFSGIDVSEVLQKKIKKGIVSEVFFSAECRGYNLSDAEYLQLNDTIELTIPENTNMPQNVLNSLSRDFQSFGAIVKREDNKNFQKDKFFRLMYEAPYILTDLFFEFYPNETKLKKNEFFAALYKELLILSMALKIDIDECNVDKMFEERFGNDENSHSQPYWDITRDNKKPELDFKLFIIDKLAKDYNLDLPMYSMLANKLSSYNNLEQLLV